MIIIGCNSKSWALKESILEELKKEHIEVLDVSNLWEDDFYDVSVRVVKIVLEDVKNNKGIILDEYGIAPFMVAAKYPFIICATLYDEHSAKMTREHNNTNVITLGSQIIGESLAISIVKRFVNGEYASGRHQIRVDMLNKMR
ncbi:MAG: galactose-6-phosphate isomerase subunit LacA [Traorella sp.]